MIQWRVQKSYLHGDNSKYNNLTDNTDLRRTAAVLESTNQKRLIQVAEVQLCPSAERFDLKQPQWRMPVREEQAVENGRKKVEDAVGEQE